MCWHLWEQSSSGQEVVAGGFSRWFVEVTGEIKVQPPAHTAVSEVQMLLLVTKAWPCAGGTRAMCSWRGGCHAGDGYSWLFWGSIATLDQTDPGGISLPSSLCHAAALAPEISGVSLQCPGPTITRNHCGLPSTSLQLSSLGAARISLLSTFASAV